MVYLWDEDYVGNPNNRRYVMMTQLLGHEWKDDWKYVKEMYLGLNDFDKRDVGKYIDELDHELRWRKMLEVKEMMNRSLSRISTKFGVRLKVNK